MSAFLWWKFIVWRLTVCYSYMLLRYPLYSRNHVQTLVYHQFTWCYVFLFYCRNGNNWRLCVGLLFDVSLLFCRCLAICYPLSYKITWRTCKIIMCGIWTFSVVLMIPYLVVYNLELYSSHPDLTYVCSPRWPSTTFETIYFLAGSLLFCYSIPLVLITTCYCVIGYKVWHRKAPGVYGSNGIIHRSKIKVVKMLVVVVVLFAASWFPLWVIQIKMRMDPPSKDDFILFNYVIPICQWLGCANSSINPIVYSLFSKKIRTRIKTILMCKKAAYEIPRQLSSYASTRYVSVDYTNGHVTLRTNGLQKERKASRTDRLFNNVYDWLPLLLFHSLWSCWCIKNNFSWISLVELPNYIQSSELFCLWNESLTI